MAKAKQIQRRRREQHGPCVIVVRRQSYIAYFHEHTRSSKIFSQPHNPAPDSLLFRHGEVFISPIERMKNGLPADFLEVP